MADRNTQFLDMTGLNYFWQKISGVFVKREGDKCLSDNNYTDEDKNKLAGMENIRFQTDGEKLVITTGDT